MAIFCRVVFLGRDNQADFVWKNAVAAEIFIQLPTSGVVTTHYSNLANY